MKIRDESLLFKLVPWFIGIVFVFIIVFFVTVAGFIAVYGMKLANEVNQSGLKPILEHLWCGQNGCNVKE